MWWDRASLHIPIWVGIFVIGFKLGGGDISQEPVEDVEVAVVEVDLEWQRCGQYGLDYWEDTSNGFYDCRKGSI